MDVKWKLKTASSIGRQISKRSLIAKSCLGAAAVLSLAGCSQPVEPEPVVRPVKTMRLGAPAQNGIRIFPGTVRAAQKAQLSFRVSAPLVRLPVSQGDEVRKGQLLAQVDPRDFRTAVASLEARLADLRAQLKSMQSARPEDIRSLEANLAASQARLVEAEAALRRYQRLYENDNVAKAEFDQRRAARDVARAEVRRAQENLAVGRSGARPEDIEAMQARIRAMDAEAAQARDRLNDTSLLAPFDGIVADTFVDNFEFVQARQPILSLLDVTTVKIETQIPESIVAQVREDQITSIRARFAGLPGREFEAEPSDYSAEADPATRTFEVTIQTSQPEEAEILAGMTAEVLVEVGEPVDSTFAVPVSAVFADVSGEHHVWVLDEVSMTARKVAVKIGELSGVNAQVLAGLSMGETIITAGAKSISEGQKLRPITNELRERR